MQNNVMHSHMLWHKQQCYFPVCFDLGITVKSCSARSIFLQTDMSRVTVRTKTSIHTKPGNLSEFSMKIGRVFYFVDFSRACFAEMTFLFLFMFLRVNMTPTFVEWRAPWSLRHFCLNYQMGHCINSLYNCVNLTQLLQCSNSVCWLTS